MIWQNRCCRNNAFLCLPSQMINVLGSSQDFLPNADSANRRNGSFRCSPETEGRRSFAGSPAFCVMSTKRCLCTGLCCAGVLLVAGATGSVALVFQARGWPRGQRWLSEERQHHRPPGWNLPLTLRSSVPEGISLKTQHLTSLLCCRNA